MFTGIIRDVGTVVRIQEKEGASLIEFSTQLPLDETPIGASIACSGICLTVIEKTANTFMVQVSNATVDTTTIGGWEVGSQVNLEPSLKLGEELGGHIVSGHVDGIAKLEKVFPDGASQRMVFIASETLAPMIAYKGSVCLDGVSLTVNVVDGTRFSVNIIPHTLTATTLGQAKIGQNFNLEVDSLARYVARQMEFHANKKPAD